MFKSNLNEILRERYKTEERKVHQKKLNCFTNHEKQLVNYLKIIIQFYLRLNAKQFREKEFQVCQHV